MNAWAPDQVAVPLLFNVRPFKVTLAEAKVIPPLALVMPAPLIVPPDHVSVPVTFTLSGPVKAPLVRLGVETVRPEPVAKFPGPPLRVSGPVAVSPRGETKFAVPLLTVVPPVTL